MCRRSTGLSLLKARRDLVHLLLDLQPLLVSCHRVVDDCGGGGSRDGANVGGLAAALRLLYFVVVPAIIAQSGDKAHSFAGL